MPTLANILTTPSVRVPAVLFVLLISSATGFAQPPDVEVCATPALGIAPLVESDIIVAADIPLAELQIQLVLDHPDISQLFVTLVAPNGAEIPLMLPFATIGFQPGMNVIFWDFGAVPFTVLDWFCACEVAPLSPLLPAAGATSLGTWTLRVEDILPGIDDGVLESWCVRAFDTPLPRTVTNVLCTTNAAGDVAVNWTNNDTYDAINVYVNGTLLATLLGTDMNTSIGGQPLGTTVEVCIEPVSSTATFDQVCCTTQITPPPPTGISCFATPAGGIDVSWSNPIVYDEITIAVNGIVTTLPGDAVSFTAAAIGPFAIIEVTGFISGIASTAATCFVDPGSSPPLANLTCVAGALPGTVDVTWDNPVGYDEIFITDPVVGNVVLPGTATSYTTSQVPLPATVTVDVFGVLFGIITPPATCSVALTGPSVPAPTGLNCVTDSLGESNLSWTNGGTYSQIEVFLENQLQTTLGGTDTSTSLTTSLPPFTSFTICVRGVDASGAVSDFACCDTGVPGDLAGRALIINREGGFGPLPGLIDSAGAIEDSLQVAGLQVVTLTDVPSPVAVIGTPLVIWVAQGTFPDGFPLTVADGQRLLEFLELGVPIINERPSETFFGFLTPFNDYDGVAPTFAMSDITGVQGLASPFIDLAPFSSTYDGEGNIIGFPNVVDVLEPSTVDLAGTDISVIWEDSSATALPLGVYYNTDAPYGNVISVSFEFGGFQGDRNALALEYLGSLASAPPQVQFVRGDANGDGNFTALLDALFVLNFGFVANSPEPPCMAAADANGSDSFTALLDGLYILNFGFSGGTAPPSPYPSCGAGESTVQALGCVTPPCP